MEREKEVVRGYKRLTELWPVMLGKKDKGKGKANADEMDVDLDLDGNVKPPLDQVEAERVWMIEAEKLVETFRETRTLFSASRVSQNVFPLSLVLSHVTFRVTDSAECSPNGEKKSQMPTTRNAWLRGCISKWRATVLCHEKVSECREEKERTLMTKLTSSAAFPLMIG
jgi:hypothetical protein